MRRPWFIFLLRDENTFALNLHLFCLLVLLGKYLRYESNGLNLFLIFKVFKHEPLVRKSVKSSINCYVNLSVSCKFNVQIKIL